MDTSKRVLDIPVECSGYERHGLDGGSEVTAVTLHLLLFLKPLLACFAWGLLRCGSNEASTRYEANIGSVGDKLSEVADNQVVECQTRTASASALMEQSHVLQPLGPLSGVSEGTRVSVQASK
jgi:hypothetical protein